MIARSEREPPMGSAGEPGALAHQSAIARPVPEPPLEWTIDPWRESPVRAVVTAALCVALPVVLLRAELAPLMAGALWIAFVWSVSERLLPRRFRVDESGVAQRHVLVWERRAWSDIRRARLTAAGLWVSPQSTPSRLDAFRGFWLPLGRSTSPERDSLRVELERRLGAHGLAG